MRQFSKTACFDWSGANGKRQPGIALAICNADGGVQNISQNGGWSRILAMQWIKEQIDNHADILIGIDMSFALPFCDLGAYFPHWNDSPLSPSQLWQMIDTISAQDAGLGINILLQHHEISRHFRHGGGICGDKFTGGMGRLRTVEQYQHEIGSGRSASCFNLVGAAQVGKSSLTGMRMLHQLNGQIPIWPFDPVPDSGPCLIEIYTSIAAHKAGMTGNKKKFDDDEAMTEAIRALNGHVLKLPDAPIPNRPDKHVYDAMVTAAWMRQAARQHENWTIDEKFREKIAKEGWTFGIN
ncbi:hypothetical protein LPB140_09925 [Sphingorhabdus lutea]|uniref:DUF429 domain-containing protein n=2 Tax=Sphingorhabdus lutea TaxID=1913578 RepID=A0A1L3JFE0_9SPHN|nr:hypothetical protein LPB140_09925 [Sphingorhabdus lutea]